MVEVILRSPLTFPIRLVVFEKSRASFAAFEEFAVLRPDVDGGRLVLDGCLEIARLGVRHCQRIEAVGVLPFGAGAVESASVPINSPVTTLQRDPMRRIFNTRPPCARFAASYSTSMVAAYCRGAFHHKLSSGAAALYSPRTGARQVCPPRPRRPMPARMTHDGTHGGTDPPLAPYEPNALLGWVYRRFFESIEVDEAWAKAVREADARGTVVYVLRNVSFVDFFALDYLTKRHGLPRIKFASEMGLWVLEPLGRGWLNALRPRGPHADGLGLDRAVSSGESAALFLKRPAHLLEGSAGRKGRSKATR